MSVAELKAIETNHAWERKTKEFMTLYERLTEMAGSVENWLHDEQKSGEFMNRSETALAIHPDLYLCFLTRKKILSGAILTLPEVERELNVAEVALRKNLKAHCPFAHRRWVIGRAADAEILITKELEWTEELLKADDRNLHAFRHFREICKTGGKFGVDLKREELQLAERLLATNYFNYSAWSLRLHHSDHDLIALWIEEIGHQIMVDPKCETLWQVWLDLLVLQPSIRTRSRELLESMQPLEDEPVANLFMPYLLRHIT